MLPRQGLGYTGSHRRTLNKSPEMPYSLESHHNTEGLAVCRICSRQNPPARVLQQEPNSEKKSTHASEVRHLGIDSIEVKKRAQKEG